MTPQEQLIRENVTLAPLTYYKIGGPARYFAQPQSAADLAQLSDFLKSTKMPYFVLGAGSNVLLDDRGYDGLVLHTAKLDKSLTQFADQIEVGASVMVIQLLRLCMTVGIAGFERLVGIPGNMGGVFYMNAGTKTGEIKDVVREITAYDLATKTQRTIEGDELKYSYRKQHFLKPHEIILRGKVEGELTDPKSVQTKVNDLLNNRKKSQPIDRPSCGSVFKNPGNYQAWQLIDKAGLRGFKIGNAQISDMHTNFIVNLGGATSADIKALIEEAKKQVNDKFAVKLEEEVKVVAHDYAEKRLA